MVLAFRFLNTHNIQLTHFIPHNASTTYNKHTDQHTPEAW